MENETKSSGLGAIIGAIIIIGILIAGGWYFIGNRVEKIQQQKQVNNVNNVTAPVSDVADIETELNKVDLNSLNQP